MPSPIIVWILTCDCTGNTTCADTVCDLVGKTFETTAVFNPDLASSREARMPEPPPPTIRASNSIVFILLVKILLFIY